MNFRSKNVSLSMILLIVILTLLDGIHSGKITNVELDPNCQGATLHSVSVTDCTAFPCRIVRGKEYAINIVFSTSQDVERRDWINCATIYLGKEVSLSKFGGCDYLDPPCPIRNNTMYHSETKFKIPYYVPPIEYKVVCRFENDQGENLACGWGSGRVY